MTGILLIDKPAGPTSHDVVARLRRTSGERHIGHTGTLDPQATGLLPLVLGRATRLASFVGGGAKTYEADVRLGFATETDDAAGAPLGTPTTVWPEDHELEAVFGAFRGTIEQVPPRHSAKKIEGRRAYDLARRSLAVALKPVQVRVDALELLDREGDRVRLRVTAGPGFYVRALARDLGDALGCGAHLVALRRTHSGTFDVERALPLAHAERLGPAIEAELLSPADALADLEAVTVTDAGLTRALHGNTLGPAHLDNGWIPAPTDSRPVRVLDADGRLVALAHARGGALHPTVVLG